MKSNVYIVAVFLFVAGTKLTAQTLQGLTENTVLKNYLLEHPQHLKSAAPELLTLPFFEDFSGSTIVPDPAKWADRYAFINSSFDVDPISIGVATLDAIDENGNVYAVDNKPTSSDRLTSQAFDLSIYSYPTDTLRLSFFYQSGGKGEVPDMGDSLLLEFFSPRIDKWIRVWYAITDTQSLFQQVVLEVPDSCYESGFRFRFRNYTSLSIDNVISGYGALSNVDCWNIDYIMMNTDPLSRHLSIDDITLIEPPKGMMDFYESIPWLHLNQAQSITRNIMRYAIRNLIDSAYFVGRSYYAKNLATGISEYYDELQSEVLPDTVDRRIWDPFYAPFMRLDDSKEGAFEVGEFLIPDFEQYKMNDTTKIIVAFKDYYAYDDGTPEFGFGITTAEAWLAYRFRVYQPDTLRRIDILFNKTQNNFNSDIPFHICVWKDEGGIPGERIYFSEEEFTPGVEPGMLDFKKCPLNTDTDLIVTDTSIFVGIQQVSDEFLNIGYDVNRNSLDRIFINTEGGWYNINPGNTPGSLMIRAVFGSKSIITGQPEVPATPYEINLFPNPVNQMLHIETGDIRVTRVLVHDMLGRIVMQAVDKPDYLNLSMLTPGIYQVILYTDKKEVITRKIVVSR